MIRAGDVVRHGPTGEKWVVAGVRGDRLAWAGWPPGLADLSDCELVESCDDDAHVRMVVSCREMQPGDDRRRLAWAHECNACSSAGLEVKP